MKARTNPTDQLKAFDRACLFLFAALAIYTAAVYYILDLIYN